MSTSSREWAELTRRLVDVAVGRTPADRVVRGGRWVCVQSGEIISDTDVAMAAGRVAYVGPDASHTVGPNTDVIEARGRHIVPGLLDGHMHVESGMLTVTEFVRAVAPHGTTGMFVDPHEIANVFGLRGVRMMVEEALLQPIHVWVQMPSCVPSAPGLETPGAEIGPDEVAEAMSWPGIIGLGEMMNFPGVIQSDHLLHAEMAETRLAGRVIGGHYASPDLGVPFHGYVAGGADDDHEGTRPQDAIARVRQGMKAMLRYGSAWHDVAAQVRAVIDQGLDPRHVLLVTDDCHPGTLVHEGHMDRVVRHAIQQGLPAMTAIQMATLNTAEHFGVSREVGQIAPGRWADLLLVDDLRGMESDMVIARGEVVAEDGKMLAQSPRFSYPAEVRNSVVLAGPLRPEDFSLPVASPSPQRVHVIGVIENQAPTRHFIETVEPKDGQLTADVSRDLAKAAMVERHRGTGEVRVGLVKGFGFNVACAVGSTVAHDSHHMIVVGTSDSDMAQAANELAQVGGGQIVVREGRVLARVELPIAGLMSDEPADVVADKAEQLLEAIRSCGCQLNNANMQLSLLGLVVIPQLRISDRGLVDVERFQVIPLVDQPETGERP
ncbi:MAG TPA: adenine deaminase [Anaerolineales bacterium]|nr:adenine deaminase [Anaerolineales bacterium]